MQPEPTEAPGPRDHSRRLASLSGIRPRSVSRLCDALMRRVTRLLGLRKSYTGWYTLTATRAQRLAYRMPETIFCILFLFFPNRVMSTISASERQFVHLVLMLCDISKPYSEKFVSMNIRIFLAFVKVRCAFSRQQGYAFTRVRLLRCIHD